MAIPIIYNFRSVKARWVSNLIAVLGIAGVVAVFVAMFSMAKGFQATLVESGLPDNVMVRRGGSTSEMDSVITLNEVKAISDHPSITRTNDGQPLVSPEVVVVASFHHKASGTDALAQVRGVSEKALEIHRNVKIVKGRFIKPGLTELVVGVGAEKMYSGLTLGSTPRFGGQVWTVVGLMDSGGSALDSEIWCDIVVLNQTYKRPENFFSSLTMRLNSISDFPQVKDTLSSDPRLTVQAEKELDYYRKQSRGMSTMIRVLGFMVAFVMGIGAVFGAFNTMYSAISARAREIATLRALGFGGTAVTFSMLFESVLIALIGGILGCVIILPLHGLTTSTLNFQTFSQVAFAFRITPDLLLTGLLFSIGMGMIGGLVPSIRAARLPIAAALREL
jgi:putative ABC transport system permease protein